MGSSYHDVYQNWKNDSLGYWKDAAEAIDWFSPPNVILDESAGEYGRWYPDATCNLSLIHI